jgi:hypothetical protein
VAPPDTIQGKIFSRLQKINARRLLKNANCPACGYHKH